MADGLQVAVVLAGGDGERLDHLFSIVDTETFDQIIISGGHSTWPNASSFIEHPPDGVHVELFWPDPATTAGEAAHLAARLRTAHIDNLTVITSDYHARRARRWLAQFGLEHAHVVGVATPRWSRHRPREVLATLKTTAMLTKQRVVRD